MESTGLERLRTRPPRCELCRNSYAEASMHVSVKTLSNFLIKEMELLVCGDCANLSWTEIEMAVERVVTQQKESRPVELVA